MVSNYKNVEFKVQKREAKKAAKELGYDSESLKIIGSAKTPGELERAMIAARKKRFRD